MVPYRKARAHAFRVAAALAGPGGALEATRPADHVPARDVDLAAPRWRRPPRRQLVRTVLGQDQGVTVGGREGDRSQVERPGPGLHVEPCALDGLDVDAAEVQERARSGAPVQDGRTGRAEGHVPLGIRADRPAPERPVGVRRHDRRHERETQGHRDQRRDPGLPLHGETSLAPLPRGVGHGIRPRSAQTGWPRDAGSRVRDRSRPRSISRS